MARQKNNGKWYHPKTDTGWSKDLPQEERRSKMLSAHKYDELAAARALQALANVTEDRETKIAAASDAAYFYKRHRKERSAMRSRRNGQFRPSSKVGRLPR